MACAVSLTLIHPHELCVLVTWHLTLKWWIFVWGVNGAMSQNSAGEVGQLWRSCSWGTATGPSRSPWGQGLPLAVLKPHRDSRKIAILCESPGREWNCPMYSRNYHNYGSLTKHLRRTGVYDFSSYNNHVRVCRAGGRARDGTHTCPICRGQYELSDSLTVHQCTVSKLKARSHSWRPTRIQLATTVAKFGRASGVCLSTSEITHGWVSARLAGGAAWGKVSIIDGTILWRRQRVLREG